MSIALQEKLEAAAPLHPTRPTDPIFDKCRKYTRADEARAAGLYPYFFPIEQSEGNEVLIDGRKMVMLGSNNYLGLTTHPRVREAAREAIKRFGTSCSGSRFLNGTLVLHEELEERLADWFGKESALVLTTGYTTNLVLSCLLGRNDIALMDISNHASLYQAVMNGFCSLKRYAHCDPADLRRRLARLPEDKPKLLLTDGVFSMEGDLAPLPELIEIKREHGFPIVVDDAHGLGVLGEGGRGTCEELGVLDDVDLITGTFSKSFASVGGVVAGPRHVIEYVKHNGSAMVFAASMSPPALGAALAAFDVMQEESWRRDQVKANARYLRGELTAMGYDVSQAESPVVAVFPGGEQPAFILWRALFDAGLFTNLAVPPGVPPLRSLIRNSLMATHTREHIDRAIEVYARVGREQGLID